jgi:hypothetical protein
LAATLEKMHAGWAADELSRIVREIDAAAKAEL